MSDKLYLDEDFRMLSKTYPADVSAIGVTTLIDYVEALEAELAARDALMERLVEAGHLLCDYAILVSVDHPIGDGRMAINDKAAWEALVAEYRASKDGGGK